MKLNLALHTVQPTESTYHIGSFSTNYIINSSDMHQPPLWVCGVL